jgi:hypothetical protein
MLGEKSMAVGGTGDGSAYTGHCTTTIRWESAPPVPDVATNGDYFGSGHPFGAYFVFCDGSVHLIRFSVDSTTFNHLGGRNDHVPVTPSKARIVGAQWSIHRFMLSLPRKGAAAGPRR